MRRCISSVRDCLAKERRVCTALLTCVFWETAVNSFSVVTIRVSTWSNRASVSSRIRSFSSRSRVMTRASLLNSARSASRSRRYPSSAAADSSKTIGSNTFVRTRSRISAPKPQLITSKKERLMPSVSRRSLLMILPSFVLPDHGQSRDGARNDPAVSWASIQ